MRHLHWFRNDLRLNDNPALASHAAADSLLCLFLMPKPKPWCNLTGIGAQRERFLHESLIELKQELQALKMLQIDIRMAASSNNIKELRQYLKKNQQYSALDALNCQDDSGCTPLIYAVMCGHIEATRAIVADDKVNLSLENKFGCNAIIYALANEDFDIFNMIMRAHADEGILTKMWMVQGRTSGGLDGSK